MPNIGAIEYISVADDRENIAPPATRSEIITRPNVNGTAIRLLGLQGEPFRKTAQRDVLVSGESAFIDSIFAQKGTLLSMVDDHNITWQGVFVMGVVLNTRIEGSLRAGGLTDNSLPAIFVSVDYLLVDTRTQP